MAAGKLGMPSPHCRADVAWDREVCRRSKRGRAGKLIDQRHEPELAAVMSLRLDKVVPPDTHFSGSSDEPSPFVNIEFHQTFVSHFQ